MGYHTHHWVPPLPPPGDGPARPGGGWGSRRHVTRRHPQHPPVRPPPYGKRRLVRGAEYGKQAGSERMLGSAEADRHGKRQAEFVTIERTSGCVFNPGGNVVGIPFRIELSEAGL